MNEYPMSEVESNQFPNKVGTFQKANNDRASSCLMFVCGTRNETETGNLATVNQSKMIRFFC